VANHVLCSNGCCRECDECDRLRGTPETPSLCTDCLRRREECLLSHMKEEPAMWASNTEESKANDGRGAANSRQHGGTHYQGIDDLLKAQHFLDKYLELVKQGMYQVENKES
jgi:hypothetical protein